MIKKLVLPIGGVVVAASLLTLAVPRAAHAVAAALVQVTNTTANPAIVQATNLQASQIVNLIAGVGPNMTDTPEFYLVPVAAPPVPYTVPTGQSLVITAIDVVPKNFTATLVGDLQLAGPTPAQLKYWTFPYDSTTHLTYPSGIVLPPGSTPQFSLSSGTPNNTASLLIQLQGYLTQN